MSDHPRHSFLFISLNGIRRSTLPVESRIRISPERKHAASSVVNRLLSTQKHGLHARRLIDLPAVSEWSDFDGSSRQNCIFLRSSLSVHLNMSEPNNGQAVITMQDNRPRYSGERLLRERPKIYRQVVRLLGEGWSANKICKWCHVTRETVRAIERREATEISARKKTSSGSSLTLRSWAPVAWKKRLARPACVMQP